MDKRLLIIANQSISDTSSDGRTLKMLLREYDPNCIAQFYLHGEPDLAVCKNYYKISDDDMISRVLPLKRLKHKKNEEKEHSSVRSSQKRNCKNLVFREVIWGTGLWWDGQFEKFMNSFNPEIVMIQGGDCPFMYNIAYTICKKRRIQLVIYNAESFLLRDELFFLAKKQPFWHYILKKSLRRSYCRCMKVTAYFIYNTDFLEKDFQKMFPSHGKSCTIMMSSFSKQYEYLSYNNSVFVASYCGTLGGGRAEMLLQIADCMDKLDSDSKLIICGRVENERDKELFQSRKNIDYLGFVPYETVQNIISRSDIILECNGLERLEARYYAFSTKIADCLACGIPFLVYASRKYPYVQYLENNNSAFIAESIEEVENELYQIMKDVDYRVSHLDHAVNLAKTNHSATSNGEKFKSIMNSIN